MGRKHTFKYLDTGKTETFDEDDFSQYSRESMAKAGYLGKKAQYKYFSEHPDEIKDQKLFSELEKEFGNDNTEKTQGDQ